MLLIGVATGANVVVAKRVGLGNKERVSNAAMTAILLAITGGIILMFIGTTFAKTFLKMTNCPKSLLPQAVSYFKIYFLGVPILMFYNFCAAILRAIGDMKRPMYFLMLGGVIKIVFTILFIILFDMTVEGVALATIVSYIVISILAFKNILKSKDSLNLDFKKIRFYGNELKEMLFIGIPTGLQSAMYSFANVTIVATVNSFGATFGAFSAIFSAQLSSFMSNTPAVIKYSQQKMIIISSTYFIAGINEVMGGVLKGMGKPILPTITTLVFMCLIRFPWVYFVFPLCPNLTFLYLIWPIGWILSIVTLLIAYFPAISKLEKQNNDCLTATL